MKKGRFACSSLSHQKELVISLDCFTSFTKLIRITAWIKRFIKACRSIKVARPTSEVLPLSVEELVTAEYYWICLSQHNNFCFSTEIKRLKSEHSIASDSCLLSLHPFVDSNGILRVGGREQNSNLTYSAMHPIILHGKHPVTRLIIQSEHFRLLHPRFSLRYSIVNFTSLDVAKSCVLRLVVAVLVVTKQRNPDLK